ncbi:MAG: DUF2095 family protein [Candidatus Hydrothermarchaeales archaeon]
MEEIRKRFPHLWEELEGDNISINGVRINEEEIKRIEDPDLQNPDPSVIDFLRRCSTEKEALEIIEFMEVRREIDTKYAKELRVQLLERGIRSFGSKKDPGYYERRG